MKQHRKNRAMNKTGHLPDTPELFCISRNHVKHKRMQRTAERKRQNI